MFRTELDRSKRLMNISVAAHTTTEEAKSCLENQHSRLRQPIEKTWRGHPGLICRLELP